MPDFEAGRRPVGERLTALETSLPEVARRLEDLSDKMDEHTQAMRAVTLALERRSASMRIASHFVEILKMAVAAAIGGAGVHFYPPHGS
nr:hypothetical protein [uncultured Rhodopila sp.]